MAAGGGQLAPLVPLSWLTIFALGLLAAAFGLAILFRNRLRSGARGRAGTWDCGYAAPTARMQYSSSSFAEMLVKLFAGILRPHAHLPAIRELFPAGARFFSHVPEVVLELLMIPLFDKADDRLAPVRRLQQGQLHLYILYVFLTLVLLLAWAT